MSETITGQTDAHALARASAHAMIARDAASHLLGIELVSVSAGASHLRMHVREDMLNGLGSCHGGFIFTLADSAFEFACNSRNLAAVATAAAIDFVAPAFKGDELHAVAREMSATGRSGVYDIDVSRSDGTRIALFRGKSLQVGGAVIRTDVKTETA